MRHRIREGLQLHRKNRQQLCDWKPVGILGFRAGIGFVSSCGYSATAHEGFATGHRWEVYMFRAGIGTVSDCGYSGRTHDSFATGRRCEIYVRTTARDQKL